MVRSMTACTRETLEANWGSPQLKLRHRLPRGKVECKKAARR